MCILEATAAAIRPHRPSQLKLWCYSSSSSLACPRSELASHVGLHPKRRCLCCFFHSVCLHCVSLLLTLWLCLLVMSSDDGHRLTSFEYIQSHSAALIREMPRCLLPMVCLFVCTFSLRYDRATYRCCTTTSDRELTALRVHSYQVPGSSSKQQQAVPGPF